MRVHFYTLYSYGTNQDEPVMSFVAPEDLPDNSELKSYNYAGFVTLERPLK